MHIIVYHLSTEAEASVVQLAHSSAEQRAGRRPATAAAAAGSAAALCTVCFIGAPPVCHDPLFLSLHFSPWPHSSAARQRLAACHTAPKDRRAGCSAPPCICSTAAITRTSTTASPATVITRSWAQDDDNGAGSSPSYILVVGCGSSGDTGHSHTPPLSLTALRAPVASLPTAASMRRARWLHKRRRKGAAYVAAQW